MDNEIIKEALSYSLGSDMHEACSKVEAYKQGLIDIEELCKKIWNCW